MATISEAYNLWANIKFDEVVDQTLKDNEKEIIASQVDQMRHGEASDGKPIGQYRSKDYSAYKDETGKQPPAPSGYVNLYNTGAFTKAIKLDYGKGYVIPSSSDEKEDKLLRKYGEKIYGLSDKNAGVLAQKTILPSLLKNIRSLVKL